LTTAKKQDGSEEIRNQGKLKGCLNAKSPLKGGENEPAFRERGNPQEQKKQKVHVPEKRRDCRKRITIIKSSAVTENLV